MQNKKPEYAIEIDSVSKRYGSNRVLNGVSLQLNHGEYLGLVGVNGAGKTTLIKSMLDFSAIDAGRINLFGHSHTNPAARSDLAFLPERFLPPYYLKGEEFLRLMCRLYETEYDSNEVKELLDVLDLQAWALDKPVRQFSKGMSQKLGLLAALLSKRKLLVLDEPMSGLDPKARLRFKRHLQALHAQGQTLFFSTHLLADVEAICDRIAVLHDGVIRFHGTPSECRDRYRAPDLESAYLACISARRCCSRQRE
jgi:ABC-2 type transport system ATP-binding protein